MLKNSSAETKIAVLEQKVSMYEEMLEKIDNAIQKISDANNNITKMLAIHEERLEQAVKSDELIVGMVKDVKDSFTKEINLLHKKYSDLDTKVHEVSKIKWMVVGIGTLLTVGIGAATQLASGWLTPAHFGATIEHGDVQTNR